MLVCIAASNSARTVLGEDFFLRANIMPINLGTRCFSSVHLMRDCVGLCVCV